MVMQYLMHFAQQLFDDSSIAFFGHASMHLLHLLHFSASTAGSFRSESIGVYFILFKPTPSAHTQPLSTGAVQADRVSDDILALVALVARVLMFVAGNA